MAKTDNLTDFLVDLADAIRTKKGTTEPINPQDFSSEIASIESGGDTWGFDTIGYTTDNSQIAEWVAYSVEKAKEITPKNLNTMFRDDINLRFFPVMDFTDVDSFRDAFNGCTWLITMPPIGRNNADTMFSMFKYCHSLSTIDIDMSNNTNCQNMFYKCYTLKSAVLRNTSKVEEMGSMFYECMGLENVTLDMSSVINTGYSIYTIFQSCSSLRCANLYNIGKSTLTTYEFGGASVWGMDGDENRQSLIDSLITYSYDRASNGMETAIIKLHTKVKALLTEEEIAQITAKGFTIA